MELTELPEEIIIMIVRELDLLSLESMYNTCQQLRNIVCMHGVIRQCNMSMNAMSTANTLKLDFFKDICCHLQELNLCGVPDLFKTTLLPVMKMLKSLRTLDVSYTNITILDLLDIFKQGHCTSLQNISINFAFSRPGLMILIPDVLLQCQSLFEQFKNVNFVGSRNNLIYSQLGLYLLEKANLKSLKFTVAECDYVCTTLETLNEVMLPEFNQFTVYLLNWKGTNTYYGCMNELPVLAKLDLIKYEFIIIIALNLHSYTVNTSPFFHSFFKDNFNIDAEYSVDQVPLSGNVAIMIWKKEKNNFDKTFFHRLKDHIKLFFPFFCSAPCETPAPKMFDWFYIQPNSTHVVKNEDVQEYEPEIRKRRIAAPNLVLNYDTTFKEKRKIQLNLDFIAHITSAITLTTNCNYLRKVTFLSLNGSVRYSAEFFNILFRCCDNLITLNVHAPPISPCASSISRSIPLTHSLKNFRLVDKRIDFRTLISSLSQCSSLENIHIIEDGESEPCDIGDPSIMLEKCKNLYNLYFEAKMSDKACVKKLQLINKAKARCNKANLNVELHAKSVNNNKSRFAYDPFIDVFNLSPIKPI